MNGEDILKQALAEGKVTIGGKEFSIKPSPKRVPDVAQTEYNSEWHREHMGTFANERSDNLDPKGVKCPDFLFESNPTVQLDGFFARAREKKKGRTERPEVQLREGIRAALRGGLSPEKIKEIFELELVGHVMDT